MARPIKQASYKTYGLWLDVINCIIWLKIMKKGSILIASLSCLNFATQPNKDGLLTNCEIAHQRNDIVIYITLSVSEFFSWVLRCGCLR